MAQIYTESSNVLPPNCHISRVFSGISYLVGGIPTPLKNDGVKVSWDGFPFPTEWKVIQHSMVPKHRPDILLFQLLTIINHY